MTASPNKPPRKVGRYLVEPPAGELVAVAAHYRNALGHRFSFLFVGDKEYMSFLQKSLEEALIGYDDPANMPGWTVEEAFGQLDQIAASCAPYTSAISPLEKYRRQSSTLGRGGSQRKTSTGSKPTATYSLTSTTACSSTGQSEACRGERAAARYGARGRVGFSGLQCRPPRPDPGQPDGGGLRPAAGRRAAVAGLRPRGHGGARQASSPSSFPPATGAARGRAG
jgi:hypothetical protein